MFLGDDVLHVLILYTTDVIVHVTVPDSDVVTFIMMMRVLEEPLTSRLNNFMISMRRLISGEKS